MRRAGSVSKRSASAEGGLSIGGTSVGRWGCVQGGLESGQQMATVRVVLGKGRSELH